MMNLHRKTKSAISSVLAAVLFIVTLFSSGVAGFALEGGGLQEGDIIKQILSSSKIDVADGVVYREAKFKDNNGRTVAAYMIDTNYGAPGSNLKIRVGTPNDAEDFGKQKVSEQALYAAMNGKNVLAAVNGDFYNTTTGEPEGLLIKDGVPLHGWTPSVEISQRLPVRAFFGILSDGTAIVGDKDVYEANKDDLVQAVGGIYMLVKDGVPFTPIPGITTDDPTGPYPRTAVGIRADGSVFFICADGRRPATYSAGISLVDLATLLVENGAVNAINLDGGGSATAVIKDPKTRQYTVKNYPADGAADFGNGIAGSTERAVANSLQIYNDDDILEKDSDGYYLIKTVHDFAQINVNSSANYRLANDIDATGKAFPALSAFKGILDGQGHTIYNLTYSGEDSYSFIQTVETGGVVKNLNFTNVSITASGSGTGTLVSNNKGTVQNVSVQGSVQSGADQVGGIVGRSSGGASYIIDCSFVGTVKGNAHVGGIVGQVDAGTTGYLTGSFVKANISSLLATGESIGGLVGQALDSSNYWIRDCSVEAKVSGASQVGGFAGMAKCGITRCIVVNTNVVQDGNVYNDARDSASLLAGYHNFGKLSYSQNVVYSGTIVSSRPDDSHRIATGTGKRTNNYAYEGITVNGSTRAGGDNTDGLNATTGQLTAQSFYEGLGFDFGQSGPWYWDAKHLIPVFKKTAGKASQFTNITLNVGADQTQRNLVWYSDSSEPGKVQVALGSDMNGGAFPVTHTVFRATAGNTSVPGFRNFKAAITGLMPDTEYVYRVGAENDWSEVYRFTTDGSGTSFSFLFAGDPQIGSSGNTANDASGWNITLDKAADWFPDTNLLISAGDQVELYNSEEQYSGFFEPAYLSSLTLVPNIGNHDSRGVNYKEHFSVPNAAVNEGDTTAGGNYWFSYNNVLFMSLNTNNLSTAQHRAFIQKAISEYRSQNDRANPVWKVVMIHHSVYSTGPYSTDKEVLQRRNELPLVFKEFGIDVVLGGHDHVYARSLMMNGTAPITAGYTATPGNPYAVYEQDPDSVSTFYLTANSASGGKFYAIQNLSFPYMAAQNQENTPNITKVDVTRDALTFTTYRTGENNTVDDVVDSFTIKAAPTVPAPASFTAEDAINGLAAAADLAEAGFEERKASRQGFDEIIPNLDIKIGAYECRPSDAYKVLCQLILNIEDGKADDAIPYAEVLAPLNGFLSDTLKVPQDATGMFSKAGYLYIALRQRDYINSNSQQIANYVTLPGASGLTEYSGQLSYDRSYFILLRAIKYYKANGVLPDEVSAWTIQTSSEPEVPLQYDIPSADFIMAIDGAYAVWPITGAMPTTIIIDGKAIDKASYFRMMCELILNIDAGKVEEPLSVIPVGAPSGEGKDTFTSDTFSKKGYVNFAQCMLTYIDNNKVVAPLGLSFDGCAGIQRPILICEGAGCVCEIDSGIRGNRNAL